MGGTYVLDTFKPRDYQLPIIDALENKGYRKLLVILSRRAGKGVVAYNLAVRQALRKKCTILIVFPTYAQARLSAFSALTMDGKRFIDYLPKKLVKSINISEMKITTINDSVIQFTGSENPSRLRGVQIQAAIYDEFAFQNPEARKVLSPVLAATPDSWELIISTPNGKNNMYDLYNAALKTDDWFVYRKGLSDLKHIPYKVAHADVENGLMSEAMFLQEYECSFSSQEGAYYAPLINEMRLNGRIGSFPWDPTQKVWSSWDLGWSDSTAIIFFSVVGGSIRIFDFYENTKKPFSHYIDYLKSKPYTFAGHLGPHDLKVHDFSGGGVTRIEYAANLGVDFMLAPNLSILDGIEASRVLLTSRVYIDEEKCSSLIRSLENYTQKWDSTNQRYAKGPLHNQFSHASDSFRYLSVSINKLVDGSSPEALDKRYQQAMQATTGGLDADFF